MSLIIRPASDNSSILAAQYLNGVFYSHEDLKIFADSVCVTIGLKFLKENIEGFNYEHYQTMDHILNVSKGKLGSVWSNLTEESKKYHEELFEVMYIRKLNKLPLMINSDWTLLPVVKWRFQIGK